MFTHEGSGQFVHGLAADHASHGLVGGRKEEHRSPRVLPVVLFHDAQAVSARTVRGCRARARAPPIPSAVSARPPSICRNNRALDVGREATAQAPGDPSRVEAEAHSTDRRAEAGEVVHRVGVDHERASCPEHSSLDRQTSRRAENP
jgi:hypothetical protein